MQKGLSSLLITPCLLSNVFASDIIVSAEKFKRNYLENTSSVSIIDEEDIEQSNAQSVADLLKREGTFSVQTNGAYGKASSLYLRGTDNRHTLVLIDGVRVTDITSVSGGTRLEFIDPDTIEKIEILKGNQGVLYGSEAIGGVISITTKKAKENKGQAKVSYGSFDNKKFSGLGSFSTEKNIFTLIGAHQDVEGISAYNDKRENFTDRDGLDQTNLELKWENYSVENLTIQGRSAFKSSRYLYDDTSADNKTNRADYKSSEYSLVSEYKISDFLNPTFRYGRLEVERQLAGKNSYGTFQYVYEGNYDRYELLNTGKYQNGELIVSLEYEKENAKALDSLLASERSKERTGVYLNNFNEFFDLLSFEEGVRYEKLQFFGDKFVYRLGASLHMGKASLKLNHGTSFKAPSLYQSFTSFGGNRQLEVEESQSSEVSLVYNSDLLFQEVTFFQIDYDNYVDYDSTTSRYINSGDYESYGYEWITGVNLGQWESKFNYSYLRSRNEVTGKTLPRRARYSMGWTNNYKVSDQLSLLLAAQYRGERVDSNGKRLPSYVLAQFQTFYQWNNGLDLVSLSINNVLDRDYEEVWGYGTPGRNYQISYRVKF